MVLAQKQTHRPREQNRRPEMKPHNYSHLNFDKVAKNSKEETASSTNGAGKTN
jgi:hypothetical protein